MYNLLAAKAATWTEVLLPAAPSPTPTPAPNGPFSGWIGKPDPSWLDGMKGGVSQLSGMMLGALVVMLLLGIILGAAVIGAAGKDKGHKEGGVRIWLNILTALAGVFIGIPVVILFLNALSRVSW